MRAVSEAEVGISLDLYSRSGCTAPGNGSGASVKISLVEQAAAWPVSFASNNALGTSMGTRWRYAQCSQQRSADLVGAGAVAANDLLRAARQRTASLMSPDVCLSRQELAELVNAWVWEHHEKVVEHSANWVGQLECGKIRWPGTRQDTGREPTMRPLPLARVLPHRRLPRGSIWVSFTVGCYRPVRSLDRHNLWIRISRTVADTVSNSYGSEGWEFESLRARQICHLCCL